MRQYNVVMGPEPSEPKTDCNANYRSVLSSERAHHLKLRQFQIKRRKGKLPDTKKA
jgi:hypothetical protein